MSAIIAVSCLALCPGITRAQVGGFDLTERGHAPPPLLLKDFSYGSEGGERAEILAHRIAGRAPIVIAFPGHPAIREQSIFDVSWLPSFLFGKGFAYAQVWGRDERRMIGSDYAARMAQAVGEIVRRGEKSGFDGSRLILMGQGWGGQIAALLATDPRYLEAAGVGFGSVRGALILDGIGFDLPKYSASASNHRKKQLAKMVGKGANQAATLSPIHRLEAPNAPRFLFHAVKGDRASMAEAEEMAAALRLAGSEAEVRPVGRALWGSLRTYAGHPNNPENKALLAFLTKATN